VARPYEDSVKRMHAYVRPEGMPMVLANSGRGGPLLPALEDSVEARRLRYVRPEGMPMVLANSGRGGPLLPARNARQGLMKKQR